MRQDSNWSESAAPNSRLSGESTSGESSSTTKTSNSETHSSVYDKPVFEDKDGVKGEIEAIANTISARLEAELLDDHSPEFEAWLVLHGLDRDETAVEIIARLFAFSTLLKGAVYELHVHLGYLPPLSGDLQEAFRDAHETTRNDIFEETMLDRIVPEIPVNEIREYLAGRHRILVDDEPPETLGSLFEALQSNEDRWALGQFMTPPDIAEAVSSWAASTGDRVLDVGIGAGVLAAHSHRSNAELQKVVGIDSSPVGKIMSSVSLTLEESPYELFLGDFLDMTSEEIGTYDSVISNPPYSKIADLPDGYNEEINNRVNAQTGLEIPKTAPLYVYFLVHAVQFLGENGRAAFITPMEYLDLTYGTEVKRYLLDNTRIHALVRFDPAEVSLFDDASTTSVLTFIERREDTDIEQPVKLIEATEIPSTEELMMAVNDDQVDSIDWGSIHEMNQSELDPDKAWKKYSDPTSFEIDSETKLSDLASIHRGIQTGRNQFFCLTDNEVAKWNIDNQYLSKLIRGARQVQNYDFTNADWNRLKDDGHPVWLLYHVHDIDFPDKFELRETSDDNTVNTASHDRTANEDGITQYLQYGCTREAELYEVNQSDKIPWYRVERQDPPDILILYHTRTGTRFIRNRTEARNINNIHSMNIDADLREDDLKTLLCIINSQFAQRWLESEGKVKGGGVIQIGVGHINSLPIRDPRDLKADVVADLADSWDALRTAVRADGDIDAVLADIDSQLESIGLSWSE